MNATNGFSERVVAELLAQLARVSHGEGLVGELTPAQWTALRYFSRANRFSRTVSAFAEFHATTRGTASQTVKSLVSRSYLTRKRSERDGRSSSLDLTDEGQVILGEDPFEVLVRAAGNLSSTKNLSLRRMLERMLGQVVQERGRCLFGMCTACTYLRRNGDSTEGEPFYECGLVGETLESAKIDQLCVNFVPGRNTAIKRSQDLTLRP